MLCHNGSMRNPSLELTHPEASRERLVAFAREVPGARVGIKIAALLLIVEGQRPGWVSEVLGLTRQSLNLWMHSVNEQGLVALKPKSRPGRPARLSEKIRQQLEADLEKAPCEFGLNRARWDGPTVARHLQRQYGIKLKVRQAQNWMHQLGYRLKRASYCYIQAHAEDAKRFQKALKKTPGTGASRDRRL
jgi:transposase